METEYYVRGVESVKVRPIRRFRSDFVKYAAAGEKYKEWDILGFIPFFFFRRKTASTDLYVRVDRICPMKWQIYTTEALRKRFKIVPLPKDCGGVGDMMELASVEIILSDGVQKTEYFNTDDEARAWADMIIEKYKLCKWNIN